MPFPLWLALALFVALLVGTGSFTAHHAVRTWRTARRVSDSLTTAGTALASRAAQASHRAELLRARAEPVQHATSALQRDLDTLSILLGELRAIQAKLAPIRALVPTK
jgi:hypothetical protein